MRDAPTVRRNCIHSEDSRTIFATLRGYFLDAPSSLALLTSTPGRLSAF
jgi:hypothetical protein